MIKNIIEFCSRNPFLVLTGILLSILGALYSIKNSPLDAIPDLSDTQVIIFTEWMGRSPDLVEDQVTYPLITRMLAVPKVEAVRGFSMFGMSFIYVIFEEGTDVYWARSRILEYMSSSESSLPSDIKIQIGPDATSLGWIFQYVLIDKSGKNSISSIREFQEFYLKYMLQSVKGVAEVATVGGFLKQYQVQIKQDLMYTYGISISDVVRALKESNKEVGARIVEISSREYFVRGRGYVKNVRDIEEVVVKGGDISAPVRIKDIADVSLVPDIRRGAADLDGEGEVVGGIIIARYQENALNVIKRVKEKIEEIKPSLPDGLELKVVYDRSNLIERAIETLKKTLIEEIIVVSIVIIIFLLHFRSALVPIISLPIGVLVSFIPMYLLKIDSNIMSLGGIAIAIGAMVDASIVIVENIHKKLETTEQGEDREAVIISALKEVGPSIFFSLLIITISFLPIFALTGQAGRLFKPLAYTKTFAMFFAAILSITLVPAVVRFVIKGKIFHESEHPISKFLIKIYRPFMYVALKNPITTILIGIFAVLSTIPLILKIGSEFMPPLYEGDLLYMPTTFPNISIEEAKRVLRIQDRIIKEFPEVEAVFGKTGRAETPTDPAPIAMVETVIKLKPQHQWREKIVPRWYSHWAPEWLKAPLRYIWPEKRKITPSELINMLNDALQMPGFTNAWTMPIKARIDMLSTGIRTPIGIKIFGNDINEIERIGKEIESVLLTSEGIRSVYSERNTGQLFLDIVADREKIAAYGLSIEEINNIIEMALGGMEISTIINSRERYTLNIRYPNELRSNIDTLGEILIPISSSLNTGIYLGSSNNMKSPMSTPAMSNMDMTNMGMPKKLSSSIGDGINNASYETAYIRLKDIATIKVETGPPMIKNENGLLVGYVYVDIDESKVDIGTFVKEAKKKVNGVIKLPKGNFLKWTGQYENMEIMYNRMKIVIPLTILIIIILLYLNFKNISDVLTVLIVLPFSLVGSIWAMHLFNYNFSIATLVGTIALLGLAAETGIVMLLYLNLIYNDRLSKGLIKSKDDILKAVMDGAVLRVRPKMMTVLTTFIGLVPLMWAEGSGADVMRRLALPMIGGLITSLFLTLEIIPVIFMYTKYFGLIKQQKSSTT